MQFEKKFVSKNRIEIIDKAKKSSKKGEEKNEEKKIQKKRMSKIVYQLSLSALQF